MQADADAGGEEGRRPIAAPLYLFTGALGGSTQGFVTVTLGFVLAHHGFSGVAIAGLIGLRLLPETWRALVGPMLDLSLNPRLWFLLSAVGAAICASLFGLLPLEPERMMLFSLLALAMGIFSNICIVAQTTAIAVTTDLAMRGRIAGFTSAGCLAGIGVGGGIGLWLASHVGMAASSLVIGGWCLVCSWPMLVIRTPRVTAAIPFSAATRELCRDVARFAATRTGLLTILAVTLPMGLGAFFTLLSSVSGDWHASADLTASTTGVLAGLASVPGCLLGGAACDRYPSQLVLAWSAVVCALGEAAMAFGPRTPAAFVGFTLLNNVLIGVAYAAVSAVVYVALRDRAGGTIGALLGSLCNVPLVAMTFLLGSVGVHHGSAGMMIAEAVVGVASALIYGVMAWLWRSHPAAGLVMA